MTTTNRRIDHLVLAVHDLDGAAAFYEGLGFRVGARNRHPWGTENRIVQFRSSFLELVTVGEDASLIPPRKPGFFSFGAFVRDYLARREGMAMLVLDSADAKGDAAQFKRQGIGDFEPFFFERKGRRPDGGETHVAFTLAFAMDESLPEAAFFVCQQHFPEAFWNPAFQQHANGATDVTAVTLQVGRPQDHAHFLGKFTGASPTDGGRSFAFPNGGRLQVAPASGTAGFTALRIGVPDLAAVTQRLEAGRTPFETKPDRIAIGAAQGFGVTVEFEEVAREAMT